MVAHKVHFIKDPADFWAKMWDPRSSKSERLWAPRKIASSLCGAGQGGAGRPDRLPQADRFTPHPHFFCNLFIFPAPLSQLLA